MQHNFKLKPDSKKFNGKTLSYDLDYRCDNCDSEVRFDAKWTLYEVNARISRMAQFPCIKVEKAQMN